MYYGVSWAVSDLSGDMYRDFILAMLIEIPALVLSVYAMSRLANLVPYILMLKIQLEKRTKQEL